MPTTIQNIADRVVLTTGWTRAALAFAAGAFGAFAMPPFSFFPALCIPMIAAVWLIDGAVAPVAARHRLARFADGWEAAKAGWWLGFGYHVAGLWWLGAAFLVEADQFAWALPLGVLGLPAFLGLFTAAGFFLACLLWSTQTNRVLTLALALGVSEWLRGIVLTGFPWNAFGMALGGSFYTGQAGALVGLNGLTILAIAIAAAPATLGDRGVAGRTVLAPTLVAALAFVGLLIFGFLRVSGPPMASQPNVRLRIMQPNMPQDEKFRADNRDAILKRYLDLSDRATSPQATGIADVTHLIWPESAFPFILSRDPAALKRIGDFLPPTTTLVTGAARFEQIDRIAGSRRPAGRYYNAIQVVQSGGVIGASYDKTHLVPFGEYLPYGGAFDTLGLRQFVHIPGGFEPGPRRMALRVPGLPLVAPLICYEAIFPGAVMPADGAERPQLFLNVTNDGWFGNTTGPYQHLAQARLRAIEEGIPMVRAANTGISAVIDPYGRVVAQLPLGVEGILDSALPKALPATFVGLYPTAAPLGLWLAMLALALNMSVRRRAG